MSLLFRIMTVEMPERGKDMVTRPRLRSGMTDSISTIRVQGPKASPAQALLAKTASKPGAADADAEVANSSSFTEVLARTDGAAPPSPQPMPQTASTSVPADASQDLPHAPVPATQATTAIADARAAVPEEGPRPAAADGQVTDGHQPTPVADTEAAVPQTKPMSTEAASARGEAAVQSATPAQPGTSDAGKVTPAAPSAEPIRAQEPAASEATKAAVQSSQGPEVKATQPGTPLLQPDSEMPRRVAERALPTPTNPTTTTSRGADHRIVPGPPSDIAVGPELAKTISAPNPMGDAVDAAPAPLSNGERAASAAGLARAVPIPQTGGAPLPPPDVVVAQVARQVTPGGASEMTIRLDPPELGSVRIGLTVTDGAVAAVVSTERVDVEALLRRHGDQLAAALEQAGYGDVDLSFSDQHAQDAADFDDTADGGEFLMTANPTQQLVPDAIPTTLVTSGMDLRV